MERQFERQEEENEYMLGRNKEGLKEKLTGRITPRKISFLWFYKRLKKFREKRKEIQIFRSVFIPSLVAKRTDLEIIFADYKERHVPWGLTD